MRLVNNTRWAIRIDVHNIYVPPRVGPYVPPDERTVTAVADGAEIDARRRTSF